MLGIMSILGSILPTVLDRVLPDQKAKDLARLELAKLEQEGEFKAVENQLSAIIAEAKSNDKWTSRARPSFLYVIYILILSAIPMGILAYFNPEASVAITQGVTAWLEGIPDGLYHLFTAGYLGYAGCRSYDKNKLINRK